ncbi:MAG: rhodoquinone biosynthesis methyltransferase RquA [Gammaproteobacteria bacterium]|nr:rhodoquinone biosynthesis methyltransferase RquA [Gammaproteobacteria bacterium]
MNEEAVALDTQPSYNNYGKYEVSRELGIPEYLQETYWWAYLHPTAVNLFERQWLVNLILWGNFSRLRDAALNEIGPTFEGRNLQVACVYGDFSQTAASRLSKGSRLDIVDVAPVQLENVKKKVKAFANVFLHHDDSANLSFEDDAFDNVIVFFLLHEQPEEVREQTVREALRVVRPGGKVVFVDYHRPKRFNPFRYIMIPILHFLEPFALGLWKREISEWVPEKDRPQSIHKETFFGSLYQKVVLVK